MTLTLLLELFRLIGHDELYATPQRDSVAAVIRQLPENPETYNRIAEEAFQTLLLDRDEPDVERFQRTVDILTVLLYHDGRTFTALLRVATLSNEHPAYGFYGINALGALANYMRRGRTLPIAKAQLVRKFKAFETNEDLVHNAGECRKMLRTAYP